MATWTLIILEKAFDDSTGYWLVILSCWIPVKPGILCRFTNQRMGSWICTNHATETGETPPNGSNAKLKTLNHTNLVADMNHSQRWILCTYLFAQRHLNGWITWFKYIARLHQVTVTSSWSIVALNGVPPILLIDLGLSSFGLSECWQQVSCRVFRSHSRFIHCSIWENCVLEIRCCPHRFFYTDLTPLHWQSLAKVFCGLLIVFFTSYGTGWTTHKSDIVQHDRTCRPPLSHTIRWVRIASDTCTRYGFGENKSRGEAGSLRLDSPSALIELALVQSESLWALTRSLKTIDGWMGWKCKRFLDVTLSNYLLVDCSAVCAVFTGNDP